MLNLINSYSSKSFSYSKCFLNISKNSVISKIVSRNKNCCDGEENKSKKDKDKKCAEEETSNNTKQGGKDGVSSNNVPKVGINGFGRIGRTALRIAVEHSCPIEIVAVNDPMMTTDYMAYLLKYDSTHGRLAGDVEVNGSKLIINGKTVCTFTCSETDKIPWKECGVEYIIESSGKFLTTKACEGHLKGGAKKVVISAPSKDATPMYVIGVNHELYEPSQSIVSAASCATNALAPMAKVVHEHFCIKEGLMTTVHAVTASQKIIDSPSKKNWRESRGGMQNMIPTYTGAAVAVGKVIPALTGKMTAISVRVPTPNVSMIDLTCKLKKETSIEDIRCCLEEAMKGPMAGIIDVTCDEVVSTDFLGSPYSTTFDAKASLALNPKFVKLISWFDNEYGYSCRIIDLINFIHAESKS